MKFLIELRFQLFLATVMRGWLIFTLSFITTTARPLSAGEKDASSARSLSAFCSALVMLFPGGRIQLLMAEPGDRSSEKVFFGVKELC